MGYGLGKKSPVVLSQSRSNFEALIERHGQWLRWRVAKKCPCVTENNRHDLHCKKCGGSGDIYDYQREYEDVFRATVREKIIPIPDIFHDAQIIEIYNSKGELIEFSRCDNFLQITGEGISNNELVDVRVCAPIVKQLDSAILEKAGGGYYRVPGISAGSSKFEGVYYQATGDVLSIEEISEYFDESEQEEKADETPKEPKPVKVHSYRRDMVFTDSTAERLIAKNIQYILPFKFVLLSQNLSEADKELVTAPRGDAVCTFPYMYNLAVNDVLTVLSGTVTHKIIIEKRGNGIDDIIPEYFVSKVDSIETKNAAYKEGDDFVIIGTNKIHWTGKQPEDNEMMSITYRYFPTYRVIKDTPMLRTSEDQRIPRKVTLKLYAAFGEAKGVNKNA
jgi:hypothetical protein